MNEMYGKRDHLTTQLEDVIPGTKTYTAMKSLIEEYSKSIQLKETSMSGPIGLMLADDAPADGADDSSPATDDNSGSDAADNGSADDSNSGASTGDDSGSSAADGDSNTGSDNSDSSNASPTQTTPPKSGSSDPAVSAPPKDNTFMIVGIIAVVAIGVTLGMFVGKKGCFAKKGESEGEGGEKDDLYVKFLNAELKAWVWWSFKCSSNLKMDPAGH